MNRFFNAAELEKVGDAAVSAEEMVNNYFKLSSGQWLKSRYDIRTARDLERHERLDGPYAQVVKYEGRPDEQLLGSDAYTLYRICIQDHCILNALDAHPALRLEPFLIYILVHELVHVVRFLRFKHRYENSGEAGVTREEEARVHGLTCEIVVSVGGEGMGKVIEFFRQWHGGNAR